MSVQRKTQINQPELTLSADQTDMIHQSVLRQFQRAASAPAAGALRLKGVSLREAIAPDAPAPEEGNADDDQNESDGDESLLDPKPFNNVMNRLLGCMGSGKRPAAKANAEPAGKRSKPGPTPPGPKEPSSRNRKTAPTPTPAPDSSSPKRPRIETNTSSTGLSEEDSTMLANYNGQLREVGDLAVDRGMDDASFTEWVKDRLAKISELRKNVQDKKKSLKRRKTGQTEEINSCLQNTLDNLSTLTEFLKSFLSSSSSGGRAIEETLEGFLNETDEVYVSSSLGLWERVLRAIAFEDRVSGKTG